MLGLTETISNNGLIEEVGCRYHLVEAKKNLIQERLLSVLIDNTVF